MAIALDGSTPVPTWGPGATETSASFTPPIGSFIVLAIASTDTGGLVTYTPSESAGLLTWTKKATNATEACEIWVSSAVGASVARTVSVLRSANPGNFAFFPRVYTGLNATPIGNVNNGGTSTTANFNAAAITTSANNSLVVGMGIDDNGASTLTSSDVGVTVALTDHLFVTKSAVTPSSGTAVTLNWTASGTPAWRWVAVELMDAGGGGPTGTALPDAAPPRRRRLLAPRRARTATPFAAQSAPVNPAFIPSRNVRTKRLLPRIRARSTSHVALHAAPVPQARARARLALRIRRGQGTQVPPVQVVITNPLRVPSSQALTRRLRAVRRSRSAQPVPAQVTFAASPYVQRPPRTRSRLLPFRRGRSTLVVPLQTAPPPPSFVPAASARARRLPTLRRGRAQPHIASQPHPPIVQPAARSRRSLVARRSRTSSPVPPQIAPIAPAWVALIPRRLRRILAKTRRRWSSPPFANTASTVVIDPNPEHVIIEQHSHVVIDQRSRVTIEQRSRYSIGE